MKNPVFFRLLLILTALFLIPSVLSSQVKTGNAEFQPEVGQQGKDVIWVPSPQALVDKMLDLAKITPEDFLVDLGSGDGRTVITAAKRGARALGIEYNPDMVNLSKNNAILAGVANLTDFVVADLFEYDFSDATIVTMFLLPEINLKLRPKLLSMKPGTRIVTNTFTMMEWRWDDTAKTIDENSSWTTAYLWIVPAMAEGRWKLEGGGEIFFLQEFQMISGEMKQGDRIIPFTGGMVRGRELTFKADGVEYNGIIEGNTITGKSVVSGKSSVWKAEKTVAK